MQACPRSLSFGQSGVGVEWNAASQGLPDFYSNQGSGVLGMPDFYYSGPLNRPLGFVGRQKRFTSFAQDGTIVTTPDITIPSVSIPGLSGISSSGNLPIAALAAGAILLLPKWLAAAGVGLYLLSKGGQ